MAYLVPLLLTLCALTTFGVEIEHAESEDFRHDNTTDISAAVNESRASHTDLLTDLIELSNSQDPCQVISCANRGSCENTGNWSFICHCQEPFTGKTCEKVRSYCEPETCGHGSCIFKPSPPYYECKCKHPYRPPDCMAGATCMPNPCQNGGTCLKGNNPKNTTFQCSCPSGYTGTLCEVGPNDCYEDNGVSYRGNVSVTVDGDECLNWNSYFILQKHRNPNEYASFEGLGPHNFCRNPDEDSQPWCYVKQNNQLGWKFCNVRECPKGTHPTHLPTSPPNSTAPFSQCGKSQPYVVSKIISETMAFPGAHPWQVSLQKRARNTAFAFLHDCGGTLLSSCWVLTAAHCLSRQDDMELQVVVGGVDLEKDEVYQQIIPVETVIVHEDYNPTVYNNDIALLKLKVMDEPFCAKETRFVRAACLPDHLSPSGTECVISGWGATKTRLHGTRYLMEAHVLLIPQEKCSAPQVYGKNIDDSRICAGYLGGGADACQGDSGGPLVCEHNETHYVEGVVSAGTGCGLKYKPGIYTNVIKFLNWIKNHMNS